MCGGDRAGESGRSPVCHPICLHATRDGRLCYVCVFAEVDARACKEIAGADPDWNSAEFSHL